MWLSKQPPETVKTWLRESSIPFLATLPDGAILWCNKAYEDLVGYSIVELERLDGGWYTLTAKDDDAENDSEMALLVERGDRIDYHFRKEYRHKSGELKKVEIQVLRYPLQGDFKFFLVSVMPLDIGFSKVIEEVGTIRSLLIELADKPDAYDKVSELVKKYPKATLMIIGGLLYLIFGPQVFELYKMFTL